MTVLWHQQSRTWRINVYLGRDAQGRHRYYTRSAATCAEAEAHLEDMAPTIEAHQEEHRELGFMTPADTQALLRAGWTQRQIAEHYGESRDYVKTHVAYHGLSPMVYMRATAPWRDSGPQLLWAARRQSASPLPVDVRIGIWVYTRSPHDVDRARFIDYIRGILHGILYTRDAALHVMRANRARGQPEHVLVSVWPAVSAEEDATCTCD